MTTKQLSFELPFRPALGREDFLVAPCNFEAIAWIDKFPAWPFHAILIQGPAGCGKTHLGSIFSQHIFQATDLPDWQQTPVFDKIVIENIDQITTRSQEEALFHWYNLILEKGAYVLFSARQNPQFSLADLQSRINAVPHVKINMPDDDLIFALLFKGFGERQITVEPSVLSYIVHHTKRSFADIQNLILQTDKLSLELKRPITIPLIQKILKDNTTDPT